MSLRARLALLVAATVLLASAVGGIGAALSSRNVGLDSLDANLTEDLARFDPDSPFIEAQLRAMLDLQAASCEARFLDDTDTDASDADDDVDEDRVAGPAIGPGSRDRPQRQIDRVARIIPDLASMMQLVRPNGAIVSGCSQLPVEPDETSIAAAGEGRLSRTVSVEGERFRMLTVGYGDFGAVQVARSLELTEQTLRGLFVRIAIFGATGAALAGALGWYLAGRATGPVERLNQAAEAVARTQDLDQRIPVDGPEELATLATSFNSMLESLHTSREQQRRLVQDASHELRTPLTSMRTNVELLQRHAHVPDDMRAEIMSDIEVELGELTDLTAELVDSAAEIGTGSLRAAPFRLGDVAAECVERAGRRHRRSIELHDRSSLDASIVGDAALVARAVTNLINNAAKFSDASEPIEVHVDQASVTVLDRGPGIPEADLPYVFDRFYRATTARSAPGSGLGLAIVNQVVEGHGGSLRATNRPGGGLEIGFSLAR